MSFELLLAGCDPEENWTRCAVWLVVDDVEVCVLGEGQTEEEAWTSAYRTLLILSGSALESGSVDLESVL